VRPIYRFGRFELHSNVCVLRKDGVDLKVEPKPLEVLAALLEHAGQLVTKADLMESVWAGRVVTESVITRCIMKLREALEDQAQSLIVSVHGLGYRFSGRVTVFEDGKGDAGPDGDPGATEILRADYSPPLRPHWRLVRALDTRGLVWLVRHAKTGDSRVLKFAVTAEQIQALKYEITIHRLLRGGLGDRPDIARFLDFNLEVQPYFLELEYCPLGNLSDWCALQGGAANLSLDARIDIMARLADALAASHRLGILHLDIKPSNVLMVEDDGGVHPRWSDFGSGRLLQPQTLAAMGITQMDMPAGHPTTGNRLHGTFNYIAPELLRGEQPTLQSDVYAMGVMLYQIVVGDFTKPLTAGWETDITDELLREDIAGAAAGDPARRLDSAMELCRRLRSREARHAELERTRRLQRESAELTRRLDGARARRPWLITAWVSLAAGLAVSFWFYRSAVAARDEALRQSAMAQGVSEFISQEVLGAASQYNLVTKRDVTVLEALDRGVAGLDARGPSMPPLVEAANRSVIAHAYSQLAEEAAAAAQIRKAIELFSAALPPNDVRTLKARYFLASTLIFDDRFADAEAALADLDPGAAPDPGSRPELRLLDDITRGGLDYYRERYASAAEYYEKALAEHRTLHPDDIDGRETRRQMLACAYMRLGRFTEADRLLQESVTELTSTPGARPAAIADLQESLGVSLFLQGRDEEAEKILAPARSVLAHSLGAGSSSAAEAAEYLGLIYVKTHRIDDGVRTLTAAYDDSVGRAGGHHVFALSIRGHRGMAEFEAGERQRGLEDLRQVEKELESALGPAAPKTEYFRYQLALDSVRMEDPSAAAQWLAQLDPKALQWESPMENWEANLRALKDQLDSAKSSRGMVNSRSVSTGSHPGSAYR